MDFQQALQKFDSHLHSHGRAGKTRYGYVRDVARFQLFIEEKYNMGVHVAELRPGDVEDFIVYLSERRNMQPASVNRILHALTSFFNCMVIHRVFEFNPVAAIPPMSVEKKERIFMSREKLAEFLNGVNERPIKEVFYTLAYTGVRVSELCGIKKMEVDLGQGKLKINNGKGKKQRTIPIHETLSEILTQYETCLDYPLQPYDYFFQTPHTRGISPSTINRWINDRREELGWKEHITAHTFRHTFAYWYIDAGGDVVELQHLMGHESLVTTSIYTHTTQARLQNGIGRLQMYS